MTFLNPLMLAGLAVVAVPLIIHLLNRRKARTVDWGAMQFLAASLARRNRKIILEELILMALRCLGLALVVLAMARPFVPASARISWAFVLPALLVATVAAAVGAVVRLHRVARRVLFGAAILVALGAAALAVYELRTQRNRWQATGTGIDLAIVVDGSLSTGLRAGESTLFQKMLEEAHRAAEAAGKTDTVSVVLAGPAPRAVWLPPTSNPEHVASGLDSLTERGPTGGAMNLPAAMELAAETLSEAPNAGKRLLVLSDAQRNGWRAQDTGAWQMVGDTLAELPAGVRVVHRRVEPPAEYVNLSVLDVQLPRRALLPGWPVQVQVTVQNTGTAAAPTRTLELTTPGMDPRTREVGALLPGDSRTLQFEMTFDKPGRRMLRARLTGPPDALPADDHATRVAFLVDELRVLVVDGKPGRAMLEGASDYVMAALAPRPAAGGLQPTLATLDSLPPADAWDDYEAIVLANVPELPPDAARALGVAVQNGTGLLIAPGAESRPEFYNELATPDGAPLCPAELSEFVRRPEDPAHPSLDTFKHPALRPLAEPEPSDISTARIEAWWRLAPRTRPTGASTAIAELSTGDPLAAAWGRGRGQIIVTAMALHHRSGNLVTRRAYLPLLHELVYSLAAGSFQQANVEPGSPATLRTRLPDGTPTPDSVDVLTPSGDVQSAGARPSPGGVLIHYSGTFEPGLYLATVPGQTSDMPFAVVADPDEMARSRLTEADLESIGRYIDVFEAGNTTAMVDAVRGRVPGREMWRQMLLCAFIVLLAEVAVGHWVNVRRRAETAREVEFGDKGERAASLRARFQAERTGGREERA